jgi:hypothetical protein
MTPEATALRNEVLEAVQVELDQGRTVDRHGLARQFLDRGSLTTLLRWVDQALAGNQNPDDAGQSVMVAELLPHAEAPTGVMVAVETTPAEPTPSLVDQPSGIMVVLSEAELRRLRQWASVQYDRPSVGEAVRLLVRAQLGMPAA